MEVTVQVHGALRGAAGAARNLDLSLPERATAGDLLALLRERLGAASLLGDFFVNYCVVKAGVYVPTVGALGPAR